MVTNLPHPEKISFPFQIKRITRKNEYALGNGFKQIVKDGLNADTLEIQINYTKVTKAIRDDIVAWLLAQGFTPFPHDFYGEEGHTWYVSTDVTEDYYPGNLYSFSFTISEWF